MDRHIVIFDSLCPFCCGAVSFIIRHDPEGIFAFAAMQGQTAKELRAKFAIDRSIQELDTILLIKKGRCYTRTDAAKEIAADLTGLRLLFLLLKIIPRPVGDLFYRFLAKRRYRLFGRKDSCMIPTEDIKTRFIDP